MRAGQLASPHRPPPAPSGLSFPSPLPSPPLLPDEADGIIAASARLLVQRDYLYGRHSHAYVIQTPTWPVEWKQITPLLTWQDYMATGQPDLALAFESTLHDRTFLSYLDNATGVLRTDQMGRHIVDWMPDGSETDETVQRGEYTASAHMSVSNAFAAQGLNLLAQMMAAGGRADSASRYAAESQALTAGIVREMWNGTHFCDGICSEVGGNSRVMTNIFLLSLGLVQQQAAGAVPAAWQVVADWGLQQIGDYGAFFFQLALASSYYNGQPYDTPDDGTAMVTALAKCDTYSWCSGLRDDNLTMTRCVPRSSAIACPCTSLPAPPPPLTPPNPPAPPRPSPPPPNPPPGSPGTMARTRTAGGALPLWA